VYLVQEYGINVAVCLNMSDRKGTLDMDRDQEDGLSNSLSALCYLQERHVMHRDIKLENILLDQDTEPKALLILAGRYTP
jgi:hypothetical protein